MTNMDTSIIQSSAQETEPQADHKGIFDLAEQLAALRDDKDQLEERLKKLNKHIDDIEYELSELMALTETQNFTRSGKTFYLITKTRASAIADRKDQLYTALKENDFGDLVYETVNANSLSSFVKEQIVENGDMLPAWLMGLINVYEKSTVGIRKAAK